jgi:phosphate transport system substrate-binding protein
VAASLALLATACGLVGESGDSGAKPSAAPIGVPCASHGQVLGSGSTAQVGAMDMWMRNYTHACPSVQIAYRPLGSVSGVSQFLRGATAFGGSDAAMDEDQLGWSKDVCSNGQGIDLPLVGGPVAIGYNLPGVHRLVLDAPTLARIFDSRITRWDDPAIHRLNPGVDLPATSVVPIHRSDGSGTTQNLNRYLSAAAPREWTYPPDGSWHGHGGEAVGGSQAVAAEVQTSEGGIGYFELSYAKELHLTTVSLDTGASHPVDVSVTSASAGISTAKVVGKGNDLTLQLDYGTRTDGAYPIVLVTYELVCDRGNQAATLPALKSFLGYAAGPDGQRPLAAQFYAPLPPDIAARVRAVIPTLS